MATLFGVVAETHRVSSTQVQEGLGHRPPEADLMVFLSFAAFFALVAQNTVKRVERRFGSDERWATLCALLAMSLFLSISGVVLGELCAGIVEALRMGSGHLSYLRRGRLPWEHHRVALFAGGVLLFWVVVLFRHRAAGHSRLAPH